METIPTGNFTARHTPGNTDIVVEWNAFLPSNQSSFPVAQYQLQYRVAGSATPGQTLTVGGDKRIAVIKDITDANTYEVCVCVLCVCVCVVCV